MKSNIVRTVSIALAMLLPAHLSLAAESKPSTTATAKAKASATSAKPKQNAASVSAKLVDINSATKDELKTLPSIGDAEANRIIAGRPYLSKAFLLTHNIVSAPVYEGLRRLVVAKQKSPARSK